MKLEGTSRTRGRLMAAGLFAVAVALYLATASAELGFDDAAEFAYCASEWGVAHPPGFPAWVMLAHLWVTVFGFVEPARSLAAFSAVCSAGAHALMFLGASAVLLRLVGDRFGPARCQWAALLASAGAAVSATVWAWSNAPEVYALQALCVALVFSGVVLGWPAWVVGVGIGAGLANHHVSMVLVAVLLPPLLRALHGGDWRAAARRLRAPLGWGAAVAASCYLVMVWRATGDYRFEFGNPDSITRLWHHLSGGFYGDGLLQRGVDYGGRAMVLGMVLLRHYGLLLLPLGLGTWLLWRRGRAVLLLCGGVLGAMVLLQLGRSYVPNMDAAIVPALVLSTPVVARGMVELSARRAVLAVLAASLVAMLAWNFEAANRRGYDVGTALLADLDASMPPRCIALVTNWEWRMLYDERRQRSGFRDDVIVVSSSIKGTNANNLAVAYPELRAALQPEYDAFLAAIAAIDPDYVFTDYYQLTTPETATAYAAMIRKLFAVAAAQGRPVVMDRQSVAFLLSMKLLGDGDVHPYGNLFSLGELTPARPFQIAGGWLDHAFLLHDLCAQAMLDNYRSSARQAAGYYRHRGLRALHEATAQAAARLDEVWERYGKRVPAPRQLR